MPLHSSIFFSSVTMHICLYVTIAYSHPFCCTSMWFVGRKPNTIYQLFTHLNHFPLSNSMKRRYFTANFLSYSTMCSSPSTTIPHPSIVFQLNIALPQSISVITSSDLRCFASFPNPPTTHHKDHYISPEKTDEKSEYRSF